MVERKAQIEKAVRVSLDMLKQNLPGTTDLNDPDLNISISIRGRKMNFRDRAPEYSVYALATATVKVRGYAHVSEDF